MFYFRQMIMQIQKSTVFIGFVSGAIFPMLEKKPSHLLVGKTWITLNTAAIRASLVPLLLLLFVYRLSNFLSSLFIYTCVLYQ